MLIYIIIIISLSILPVTEFHICVCSAIISFVQQIYLSPTFSCIKYVCIFKMCRHQFDFHIQSNNTCSYLTAVWSVTVFLYINSPAGLQVSQQAKDRNKAIPDGQIWHSPDQHSYQHSWHHETLFCSHTPTQTQSCISLCYYLFIKHYYVIGSFIYIFVNSLFT